MASKTFSSQLILALQVFSKVASVAVIWIGFVVIIGWILDIAALKSILPGLVTMTANTALGLISGGAALRLLHRQPTTQSLRSTIQAFAVIVLLIGLLKLIEYSFNWNLGIDHLLFHESADTVAKSVLGRMPPNTALNFLMLGSALLLLTKPRPNYFSIQLLALISFLISWLGLIVWAYDIQSFYGIGSHTYMALHTAVAFTLLCLGILFFRPDRGVMAVVTNNHAGGIMARRLVLVGIAIPPILGWLILIGYRKQLYDNEFGMSLLAVCNIVIFAIFIWINARALGVIDDRRQKAEEQSRIHAVAAAQGEKIKKTLQELKKTQAQLIQSEKMSSLGQLVAGVAHEINNPVNFIYANLVHANEYTRDLLELIRLYQQSYPHPSADIQEYTEAIDLDFLIEDLPKMLSSMKVGAERIRQIVLTLRNFSRLDEAQMKAVDIHEGIDSTLLILQNRLKTKPDHPGITVVKEYGNLPIVECYAGQLNQVFMNILNNAVDALDSYNSELTAQEIQEHPSTITIRTEVLHPDYITVRIADNGPGMTEEVKGRLFDPFFTTKPVGQGTGLGLSISYQIVVEKHGGALWCESVLGQGTEFWIKIPIRPSQQLSTSSSSSSVQKINESIPLF